MERTGIADNEERRRPPVPQLVKLHFVIAHNLPELGDVKGGQPRTTAMPLILRRYRTSAQTVFIETAALIFAYCDARYAIELREIYPNIRDPYARSAASFALGFQKDDEAIPMLMREYEQLRKDYPEESYDQGPLLALYHLYGKL